MTQLKDFKGVALYTAGALTVFAVQWGVNALHAYEQTPQAQVLAVCNDSRLVNDGAKEEKCGDLQDLYNYEYLCDGIEASSSCWVEKNDNLSD